MSDRELLEAAARAAGLKLNQYPDEDFLRANHAEMGVHWNPRWNSLEDDGDEARLEAALELEVLWFPTFVQVGHREFDVARREYFSDHGGDKQAARRRAGTRAAAAIGGHHG